MIDVLGRSIQRDDIISYPVRQGSQMWVNVGSVLDVCGDHIVVGRFTGSEVLKTVRVSAGERVTIAVRGQQLRDLCDIGDRTMGTHNGNDV